MSPTARSLAFVRQQGAIANVVERYNSFTHRRHDLFGFIDIVALDAKPGCLGIQTTTVANQAARLTKMRQPDLQPVVALWLAAGNRLIIHGWAKRGPRGKRKRWTLSEKPITLEELS